MQREIIRFHVDDDGDWVADLECHHAQHVRHRPPFQMRSWVETAAGRDDHLGTTLACPLCDRAELPDGLVVVRTAGPFDEMTLPSGLRHDHRVAARTWGMLRVRSGSARIGMQTEPPIQRDLYEGDSQAIPPGVIHAVELAAGTIEVDFLVAAPSA